MRLVLVTKILLFGLTCIYFHQIQYFFIKLNFSTFFTVNIDTNGKLKLTLQ